MIAIVLATMVLATEAGAPAAYAPDNEELRGYLLEAGERSPALKQLHAEWEAALERIPQAVALDDPVFSLGYFLQSETNDYRVMLSQKLPWFGTLRLRGEQAALEADAAMAALYNERNQIFADVKSAYYEYAYLGGAIRVTESQLEVLDYVKDIVQSKYEVAMAKEDELLRVTIEITKTADRRDGFLDFKPAVMARLNEAIGAPVDTERPMPQETPLPAPLPAADEIRARVAASNPDLERLQSLIESRAKQAELARKKGYPDFTFGLEYVSNHEPDTNRPDRPYPATLNAANRLGNTIAGNTPFTAANTAIDFYALGTSNEPIAYPEDPEDNLMISLTVNVPIWRKKIKAGIAEAQLMQEATTHQKRRRNLELDNAAQMAIFDIEAGQRRYFLYRDSLTPQAKAAYDSVQSQYSTGDFGTDFLDVLDSIQALLNFELEQVRARRDWQISAARLEFLMGGPLTAAKPTD